MTEALLANHYIRIGGYLGPIANGQYTGYYTSPVNITKPVSNPNYPGGGVVVAGIYPASITNSSTINGSPGPGIYMGPGSVTNTKSGVIIGGNSNVGVEAAGEATIVNAGTITATGADAVGVDLKSGGAVTNLAGGSITAPSIGIAGGGTITNSGSISSGNDGIELFSGGQITNAGSTAYIGGADYGILVFGAATNVTNSGSVTSSSIGIDLEQGGTITNMAGGSISGAGEGIRSRFGSVTVINKPGGTITGGGYGVNAATVINSGTITGGTTGVTAGYLENQQGGTIIGGSYGVTADTLVNQGLISGTAGIGVYIDGGSFTNAQSGTITATAVGVETSEYGVAGALVNDGTIGLDQPLIGVRNLVAGPPSFSNGDPNNTTATIYGTNFGFVSQAPRDVYNYGTISAGDQLTGTDLANALNALIPPVLAILPGASGSGVYLQAPGNVYNMPSGTITGARRGVYTVGGGNVTNSRNLQSGQYYGVISGTYIGVQIVNGPGAVTNSGKIFGDNGIGVEVPGGVNVYNNQSGTISGGVYGVLIDPGSSLGTVTNSATISQTGGTFITYNGSTAIAGVEINGGGYVMNDQGGIITGVDGVGVAGAAGFVTNFGKVAGGSHDGVFLQNGGAVTNGQGGTAVVPGTITGGVDGVMIIGAAGTVTNYNSIAGFGAAGVYLKTGGIVNNGPPANNISPRITGEYYGVLVAGGNGVVDNSSSITGYLRFGVDLRTGGTVNDAQGGTITGSSTVSNSGSSTGLGAGVYVAGSAGTVNNLGTITGTGNGTSGIGVYLKAGGAVTNGATNVNTAVISGSRIGVVALAAGTTIMNFGTISGGSGTAVELAAGDLLVVEPGAVFVGAVAHFDPGDTIDFADEAGTGVTFANGVLTLMDGSTAVTSLDLSGSFDPGQFTAASDGNGGTDVSLAAPAPNPPPPAATTADMILRDAGSGGYEIYDLGNNTILAGYALGQVGTDYVFAGLGDFSGSDTTDMLLRSSSSGAFEVYDISNNNITAAASLGQVGLEWEVAGFGDFNGSAGGTDMMLRDTLTGAFEVYDIANNTITSASAIGQVGLEWQVAGFGDFSSHPNETDMLLRNVNTGTFEVYDINNSQLASASTLGQVGVEWQLAGFGDFSGNPNETDMMLRNVNTGVFELYDIQNNQITTASAIGQVGLEWQVAGFGPLNGAGTSDMVLRDTQTGAFEVYDIATNQLTGAASLGQVGLEWQVGGFAADPFTILAR